MISVRGGILEDINEAFLRNGLYHITSILGLHMAMVSGKVTLLVQLSFAIFHAFTSRGPVKKYAVSVLSDRAALTIRTWLSRRSLWS